MRNNKKILIVGIISLLVMIGVIGGAFAYFIFANTTDNQVLIAGDVYMKYTESNTFINAELMMPRSEYDPETYFEFTIEGKNTYSKDIYYEILINQGDPHGTRKTRIDDKFLRFRLEEIVGEDVTPVIEEGTYEEIDNTKIWVNTIKANTKTKASIKYKLYMWITDEVSIGDNGDYKQDVWNNDVFASIKVSVNGDFEEKKLENDIGTEVIKATLGQQNGIIAVSTTNQKLTEKSKDIREYRYSGTDVNNYVYFNCEEGKPQNATNCEKWRIVGVFKDENGAEHLKIVKNETLKGEDMPLTYKVSGTEYKIKYNSSSDLAYWYNDKNYKNDWATAGLQYWLNSEHDDTTNQGYLSKINATAKSMIEDKTKYYLGTVTYYGSNMNGGSSSFYGIKDTPNEAYANERAVSGCTDGKGPSANSSNDAIIKNETCRVWANNSATWEGNVAFLYPSDYGYSANSSYWNTKLGESTFEVTPSRTSWLSTASRGNYEWFLSPSSEDYYDVARWGYGGCVISSYTGYQLVVRPCLYLKSEVKIIDGDGTEGNAYQLSL